MHRVVAGCNLWALLFLGVALAMGALRSPYHVQVGIFAAIFALLAQCVVFALFMGASKLVKEHVALFRLPDEHIARVNAILFPVLGRATLGSLTLLVFAILAGLSSSGEVPPLVHAVLGVLSIGILAGVLPGEVRGLATMHEVLGAMERALPEPGPGPGSVSVPPPAEPSAPGQRATPPATPADLRARALVYMGTTLLAVVLGYRFISGFAFPNAVLGVAFVIEGVCLASAYALSRRSRGLPSA